MMGLPEKIGIWHSDSQMRNESWSNELYELLELPYQEVTPHLLEILPEAAPFVWSLINSDRRNGEFEFHQYDENGDLRHLLFCVQVQRNLDGSVNQLGGVLTELYRPGDTAGDIQTLLIERIKMIEELQEAKASAGTAINCRPVEGSLSRKHEFQSERNLQ